MLEMQHYLDITDFTSQTLDVLIKSHSFPPNPSIKSDSKYFSKMSLDV